MSLIIQFKFHLRSEGDPHFFEKGPDSGVADSQVCLGAAPGLVSLLFVCGIYLMFGIGVFLRFFLGACICLK